jgi:hypothetical protein
MNVYIVTDGSYSDYHILGVYSTKEKAEDARYLYASENPIEDIELDLIPIVPPGMKRWRVEIFKDGLVDEIKRISCNDDDAEAMFHRYWEYSTSKRMDRVNEVYLRVNTWARDEDHAIKIANEKRMILLAAGKWGQVVSGEF